MDISAYLERIQVSGQVRPDLETLRKLHRAHLVAIPYENFDVQLKRPASLDPTAAYARIVERRRGGWCYEMNGLFGWALSELGFNVSRRAAGSGMDPSVEAVIGGHLALQVEINGQGWGVDVGFGDGPIEPFLLRESAFQQRGFPFRVELKPYGWRLHNHQFGMRPFYDSRPADEGLMAEHCHSQQTAPDSPFVLHTVTFRHDEVGYASLIGRIERTVRPDGVTKRLIEDAADYVETLDRRFAVSLPEAADIWPVVCERHEAFVAAKAASA